MANRNLILSFYLNSRKDFELIYIQFSNQSWNFLYTVIKKKLWIYSTTFVCAKNGILIEYLWLHLWRRFNHDMFYTLISICKKVPYPNKCHVVFFTKIHTIDFYMYKLKIRKIKVNKAYIKYSSDTFSDRRRWRQNTETCW